MSVLVALCILIVSTGTTIAAPNVVLNGNKLVFNLPPIIEYGRTLVPLRTIFEALGATVTWEEDSQTVTAVKGTNTIKLQIGSYTATINDKPIELSVPGKVVDGRTMVPLRFVSEAMGCKVDWADQTQTVVITDSSTLDSKTAIYSDPKGRFAVTYPSDWLRTDIDKAEFVANPPLLNSKNANDSNTGIMIMIKEFTSKPVIPMDFAKTYTSSYIKSSFPLTETKIISETNVTIDGLPAYEIDFTGTMEGTNLSVKWIGLFTNSSLIQIASFHVAGEDIALINKLDSIVKSIQIVYDSQ